MTNEIDKKAVSGKQSVHMEIVRRGFAPGFVKKPHVAVMLADNYTIIAAELRKLRALAETDDEPLTLSQVKAMGILADKLVQLAKEEREQLKEDGLPNLTDKELLAAIEDAKKALDK